MGRHSNRLSSCDRLEFARPPGPESWLNMAAIELSLPSRQRLKPRVPDADTLRTEIAARPAIRNADQARLYRTFRLEDARKKLHRLYPGTFSLTKPQADPTAERPRPPMKIAAAILVVLLALLPVCTGLGMDPSAEPFQEVRARAKRLERTAEGKAYEERFAKGFEKSLRNALRTCTQDLPLSTPFGLVLVIAADGTIERIVAEPGQAVAECLALKLQGVKLAAPPKAGWLVLVKVAA